MFSRLRKRTPGLLWYLVAASFCQPTYSKTPAKKVASRAPASIAAAKPNVRAKLLIQRGKHWWVDPAAGQGGGSNEGGGASDSSGNGSQLSAGSTSSLTASGGGASGLSGAGGLGGLSGAGGSSASGGSSSQSGSAGGLSGSGASSGASGGAVTMDDSQAKGQPPGGVTSGGSNGGGGGGGAGQNPTSTAFPLWFPMCLFVDPNVVTAQRANKTIKEMTDAMAKCNVNLVVFPVTVNPGSYPQGDEDSDKVNALQTAACNIAGNVDNATRASTSFCVNNERMAGHMCRVPEYDDKGNKIGWDPAVAGCAQINSGPAEKAIVDGKIAELERRAKGDPANNIPPDQAAIKRLADIKSHNQGGGANNGGDPIAPSIERTGACDGKTVSHEAIGHSMFGHPNGAEDGFGIGFDEGPSADGWSGSGCAAIQRNAFGNDGKWRYEANRQTYYVQPKDPSSWWDFNKGRKLFNPPQGPPGPGTTKPPQITGSGKTIVFDDSAKKGQPPGDAGPVTKKGSASSGGSSSQLAAPDTIDPRHKKQPGIALAGAPTNGEKIAKSGQGISGESIYPEETSRPRNPPPKGDPKGTQSITFDDNAAKNRSGAGGANATIGPVGKLKVDGLPQAAGGRAQFGFEGGNGNTQSVTFDDNAAKGEPAGSAQLRLGPPSGGGSKGGASVSFDDSAAKGGGPGSVSLGSSGGGSGGRSPASSGSGPTLGKVSGDAGPGFSNDFFSGIGRSNEMSDDERDEQQRRRRRKKIGDRLGEGEPAISRRTRPERGSPTERKVRAISEGDQ